MNPTPDEIAQAVERLEIATRLTEGGVNVKDDGTVYGRDIRVLLAALKSAQRDTARLEDAAVFIKRLVRKCYTLGHRSKLTDDAMAFINGFWAKCSPMRKLAQKISAIDAALTKDTP